LAARWLARGEVSSQNRSAPSFLDPAPPSIIALSNDKLSSSTPKGCRALFSSPFCRTPPQYPLVAFRSEVNFFPALTSDLPVLRHSAIYRPRSLPRPFARHTGKFSFYSTPKLQFSFLPSVSRIACRDGSLSRGTSADLPPSPTFPGSRLLAIVGQAAQSEAVEAFLWRRMKLLCMTTRRGSILFLC